jgi:hypothetical protein
LGEPYPAVLHFAQATVAEPTTIGGLQQPLADSVPDQPRGKAAAAPKRERTVSDTSGSEWHALVRNYHPELAG